VKRTFATGVYKNVTRRFPYKSGEAGVYPGKGMSFNARVHGHRTVRGYGCHGDSPRYKNRENM